MHDETHLICFVRYPEPGKVKTRLAEGLGEREACELYRRFVADVLACASEVDACLHVFCHPAEEIEKCRQWLGRDVEVFAQRGADLGERMKNSLSDVFSGSAQRAVIIGSDAPDVPSAYISEAFRALQSSGCAVGPAADGGYYLIGFRRNAFLPGVFEDMPWGTSSVLEKTMSCLASHSVSVYTVPGWYDIDTIEDLGLFVARNAGGGARALHTAAYMRESGII